MRAPGSLSASSSDKTGGWARGQRELGQAARAASRAPPARTGAAASNRCALRHWSAAWSWLTADRVTFTCAPAVKPGLCCDLAQRQHGKTDRPQAEAANAGLSCRESTMCNPGHCADAHERRRPVRRCRRRSADHRSRCDTCARSTPWRVNTSCGSQQAPRLRSSQTSLRIFVICRPCAKDAARALKRAAGGGRFRPNNRKTDR